MNWQIYRADALGAIPIDISDDVLAISGYKRSYSRLRKHIIMHPTIKVNIGTTINKGDYLYVKSDGYYRAMLFVSEKKINRNNIVLECWNVLKKLDEVYLADFDTSFWSGYTPDFYEEYRNGGTAQTHWITCAFLLRVMLHYVTGVPISSISDSFYDVYSHYNGKDSSGNDQYLKFKHIGFGWDQLKSIKKNNSTDDKYKTATLLDVYFFISQTTGASMEIRSDITSFGVKVKTGYSYTPGQVIGVYEEESLEQYGGLAVRVKKLTTSNAYGQAFVSSDFKESAEVPIISGNEKIYTINFIQSMFFYRIYSGIAQSMTLYGADSFVKQTKENKESMYTSELLQKTFETRIDTDINAISNQVDFKNMKSKIITIEVL